jgi:hypothetical protein
MQKGAEEGKRKLNKEAENEKKKWKIRKKRYWNHAHVLFLLGFSKKKYIF